MRKLIAKRGDAPKALFSNQDLGLDPEMVQGDIFTEHDIKQEEQFISSFFAQLKQTVQQYAQASESDTDNFLSSKTRDAITFLELLTTKYDVATANPPYTDRADFGPELRRFIELNYENPHKFHTNLYATFIKRCYELTTDEGKVALIHPHTFMFIKTFEGVREFMLESSHIDVMVDYGLDRVNLFGPGVLLDATFYVLSKSQKETSGLYFNLASNLQEKYKKGRFLQTLDDYINKLGSEYSHDLPQSKLKIIKSWPFIYWISDAFREKFESNSVDEELNVRSGITTSNNFRCVRFHWEVLKSDVSSEVGDKLKWVGYAKGGPFQKWVGNDWLVIDFSPSGHAFLATHGNHLPSREFYFREGITYSASGSKGASFRLLPKNRLFDTGGSSIFTRKYNNIPYSMAVLNSKLAFYIAHCFNPTVNTQGGDLKRIPFVLPDKDAESGVEMLSNVCINITQYLNQHAIVDKGYLGSPVVIFRSVPLKQAVAIWIEKESHLHAQILINEAIIDEKVFEVYGLTKSDKAMVLAKEGESIGGLPVLSQARKAYLAEDEVSKEFPLDNIQDFIEALPTKDFTEEEIETITAGFPTLYQSNNDLEEFCIKHQVNPINVWYWFKQSQIIPEQRMHTLAMEFLVDMVREILMEDEDGIIPLVPNAGETILLDRIEEKFREKGFSQAQYSSFDSVLGRPLPDYLNKHLFAALSDHLNLFMYLPKTPFIWHLSSGPEQGFDCYIIIYKWSKDKLLKIRSQYIENRERSLVNRQSDLATNESADAQNEKERIYKQLKEIEAYKTKIDELLAEGYDPILDDGVGKNIAPLQKKGMIPYEVLNPGQLKKYLKADW